MYLWLTDYEHCFGLHVSDVESTLCLSCFPALAGRFLRGLWPQLNHLRGSWTPAVWVGAPKITNVVSLHGLDGDCQSCRCCHICSKSTTDSLSPPLKGCDVMMPLLTCGIDT